MKFDQISVRRGIKALVVFTLFFTACKSDKGTNIPDVSDIKIDIDMTRFEQLLLADTMIDAAGVQKLMEEHPAFSEVYFNHVLPGAEDMMVLSLIHI